MPHHASHEDGVAPAFALQGPPAMSSAEGIHYPAEHFQTYLGDAPMLYPGGFDMDASFPDFMTIPQNVDFSFVQPHGLPMHSLPESAQLATPSPSASPNDMNCSTSADVTQFAALTEQSEDEKPNMTMDSPLCPPDSCASTNHPTPAESTTTWCSHPPVQEAYDQQNATPIVAVDAGSPQMFARRNSSTAGISDSMLDVGIDNSASESESSLSPTTQPSSLAARRQRPRPAALQQTALRSASYSTGMPNSPGADLRRIRSHGIAAPGRIAKVPGPQKSPMHANFEAAAAAAAGVASPKFNRHVSNYSVSSSNGPLTATTTQGSLAPLTPVTPSEFNRLPWWQPNVGKMLHPDCSPGAFSHAGDNMHFYQSSPIDFVQEQQLRATILARQAAVDFHTPPQSAPATQQHFGLTPPSSHPQQMMAMSKAGLGHIRRPSLPEQHHNAESQETWQPGPFLHPVMPVNGPIPGDYHPVNIPVTPMDPMTMTPSTMPNSMYDPAVLNLMAPPMMHTSSSKVHFHNQGPEDFQHGSKKN